MIEIIIKIVCIIISAISKAVADTVAHHKGGKLKGDFWDMSKQGKFFPLTKYPMDGWHLSNSLMIVSFITAGIFTGYKWYIDIPALGIIFILVFNTFYNKILK